jgi:large subunit ribosomal protein L10
MLNKDQKKTIVKDLEEKLKTSKSVVFVDFKGIKVKDMTGLKRDLRKEGVEMKVTRKTLFNIALKEAGMELNTKAMDGQVAISISQKDEVAPAKIIFQFAKTNENLKILGGILGTKPMTAAEVNMLAKLPSKEELLAKLVGTINAPVSGFVNVLAANIRGLVQVLKAVSDSKAN